MNHLSPNVIDKYVERKEALENGDTTIGNPEGITNGLLRQVTRCLQKRMPVSEECFAAMVEHCTKVRDNHKEYKDRHVQQALAFLEAAAFEPVKAALEAAKIEQNDKMARNFEDRECIVFVLEKQPDETSPGGTLPKAV